MKETESKANDSLTLLGGNETQYPESPELAQLETFVNRYAKRPYTITFECPEFTSRCPVTNQPDFGRITVKYVPNKQCIESKSLKLYLFAFRNHNTFHEEAVNRILEDLVAVCEPRSMTVFGHFNPRGGISINVEASYTAE
jgi:7-cyano-7-deazaguanine reductase